MKQKYFDFDSICVADQIEKTNQLIKDGYVIPDLDGSKSSIIRKEAVLNNSFNEDDIRETLKDIYLNNSHRLIASNTANTHFFQWTGSMKDMTIIPNTNLCEFRIPTEGFINAKERDLFKLSQFYRKWIKVEDLLNHWDIFKWHCLLFIHQKIYSEYELRIDDHETTIRFKYYNHWLKSDDPVYIYKLDTNAQCRILISRELCEHQWNWKIPTSYLSDQRVGNRSKIILYFNKTSDPDIRKDGLKNIEVIGDNLEFLEIKDGYIDLSSISNFNKNYIKSELTEYLWMSIIVPKFLHEFPILLPTDVIYRPYEGDLKPVVTLDYNRIDPVKLKENQQVYVDLKGGMSDSFQGWKEMIRPLVLSDAIDQAEVEPSELYLEDICNLRDLTVKGADIVESFRFSIKEIISDETYQHLIQELLDIMYEIQDAYHNFLEKQSIEYNDIYESTFQNFLDLTDQIKKDGIESDLFEPKAYNHEDYWLQISPLIHIPRTVVDKYLFVFTISSMGDKKLLWEKEVSKDQVRFNRPIDENDFWTFEYNADDGVWRPYPLAIEHHFPDVYILKDEKEEDPTPNRIFKSFIFYSDTMNVLKETVDVVPATPDWDKDLEEFQLDQEAIYRDIFMEKFYWMGIQSIYKGILQTKCKWEVIEYIIDNDSYERFNQLFMNTIDPYFKLGITSYLRSSNYGFPLDEAIAKMKESISMQWLGYKKVTNFEIYLNKNWKPSYFDYVLKITDDWDYKDRLIRRPRSSFDMTRLYPLLLDIQNHISLEIDQILNDLNHLLEKLYKEHYNLNIHSFEILVSKITEMKRNLENIILFTENLDMDIYSINDINYIIQGLKSHIEFVSVLKELFHDLYQDIFQNNIYIDKKFLLDDFIKVCNLLKDRIQDISSSLETFHMEDFMKAINDLRSYLTFDKYNPEDQSLLGYINKFEDPWSIDVKEKRNHLFTSTTIFYGLFDPNKSYKEDEIDIFLHALEDVKKDLQNLRGSILNFWEMKQLKEDPIVIDKFYDVEEMITAFTMVMDSYMDAFHQLVFHIQEIKKFENDFRYFNIGKTEISFLDEIFLECDHILSSMSYIVGSNKKEEALLSFQKIERVLVQWIQFIEVEKEVFDQFVDIFQEPAKFLVKINHYHSILEAILSYMDTVNMNYIPDPSNPTYADIYEVDEIEIISGGFGHKIGDMVFIPSLGSYKIIEVVDEISRAISMDLLHHRKTVFRNPMIQTNPYDTITSGNGLGILVKPLHVNRIPMMDDSIISPIIMRIQNISYLIQEHIKNANVFDNIKCEETIRLIQNVISDKNQMLEVYKNHISTEIRDHLDQLIDLLSTIIQPLQTFMEFRNQMNVQNILNLFDTFIISSYRYIEENIGVTKEFLYYDQMIRTSYQTLSSFYGNGTSWKDEKELKRILNDLKYPIHLYHTKVFINMNMDEIGYLLDYHEKLVASIDQIILDINRFPNEILDIESGCRRLENKIKEIPKELQKDIWYRIKSINVALEGSHYKVGDIVEIIPRLPTDENGNEIHGMDDIILHDVILLKVMKVKDGNVLEIQPLMDYAIPYFIWGIRDTISRTGSGSGLTVDVFSNKVNLEDSILFEDQSSDLPKVPPFNENDLFRFQFENIHDLPIDYEVFLGGKQIVNFFHRHISNTDPYMAKNIDVIYIHANTFMDLQNSSIYQPSEHFFTYRLDNMKVVDSGTGYSVGQTIFVDGGEMVLKLKVSKLKDHPLKGIEEVVMGEGTKFYEVHDPSSNQAIVVDDSLNNIDDEFHHGYYDQLTEYGIEKPATKSYDVLFTSKRFDSLPDGDRNKTFMYPDVSTDSNGDPDGHWYLGNRFSTHISEGILNTIPPTHPFIPDELRVPTGKPLKGEYQFILRQRIHNSINEKNTNIHEIFEHSLQNTSMIEGDYVVNCFQDLPKHLEDWKEGGVGKTVIVTSDETNQGHRMLYRIRTFVASGFFVYEFPEIADYKWNVFSIDWMNCDYYPDIPSIYAQYPSADWDQASYRSIQHDITDGKMSKVNDIKSYGKISYIHNLTVDDLSVFNWTTKKWEDLHDEHRWKLEVQNDYGFTLIFLEEGTYSYDMSLYLNKIPDVQMRNASLKKNAILDITASISSEVSHSPLHSAVYTGRHFRIRKLFPFEQKESFIIGKSETGDPLGYKMNIKIAPYMHFRNELHLEDIKVFNKSAGRFENVLDRRIFEVRFKDEKAFSRGFETQTTIIQSLIGNAGEGFVDGNVWCWNSEFQTHVFGYVTVDYKSNGKISTFLPLHMINPPEESITLEFVVYQSDKQSLSQQGIIVIEFQTKKTEVFGDGYLHDVSNRFAPLPKEFQLIVQYNLDGPQEYEVILDKNPRKWIFIEPKWMMSPIFHLDDYNVSADRLYILTDKGRFPLVNPSTLKPSIRVEESGSGTDVTFLNLYRRYEHLEIHSVPYPMRSVYVQRNIPAHGYLDLKGKLNKPLNKKYFEFWVNGKLLMDEVTIISPTKLILHGLKSLKNLEIIEINRDPNEYFSDTFMEVEQGLYGRPYLKWNYDTYLDGALDGTLEGDNYSEQEQEYLLSPVWKQVEKDHPEFKNYPPNVDLEDDILLRANSSDYPINDLEDPMYQFLVVNSPTIEGKPLTGRDLSFKDFGFTPITNQMLIDMMNEEWSYEIEHDPYFPQHTIMTDDEWYGMVTRLYDEYGILVHNLDDSVYHITDENILRINVNNKLSRIVRNPISYDLD